MKRQILFLSCLFYFFSSKAQTTGARSAGLGSITSITSPGESITGNVGCLAGLKSKKSVFTAILPFGIPEVSTGITGFLMPLKTGIGAISVSRFGTSFYSKTSASLDFAHKIEFVSLGAGVTVNRYSISESGSRTNYILKFGGIAEVSPDITFGAYISNFSLSKVSKETGEREPVILTAGLSWQPVESTLFLLEAFKEVGYEYQLNTAIEYSLTSFLAVRVGYSGNPGKFHCGVGLSNKKVEFSYAAIVHPSLPPSHYLTLGYNFLK